MLKIKLLRMSQGLSQWELSHQSGMSQGRYSMIERGLIEPTADERHRLATILNASGSTLFRTTMRERRALVEAMPHA
jgi:transcriptional regulator with XRE-family HTH domain